MKRKQLTPYDKRRLACSQKYKCAICNEILPAEWQVDHIKPLFQGGSNEMINLQILCANCHARKSCEERANYNYSKPTHLWTKLEQLTNFKYVGA